MPSKKTLYIVDGHGLCYRAYYAFIRNPLYNSKGQNTSAIFGFARMLLRLIQEQKPEYLAVAFDPPGPSFRVELFPDYKANRKKMPDDLRSQIEEIKSMLDCMDIPRIEVSGYEADDIIGTMARKHASNDLEVVLVTGDKDAYQLVNDNVRIYANKKGISEYEILDETAIKDKLGIRPDQVIDYMALMGDSSDNVPGVKGIGEKTAASIISKYSSLEALYKNLDEFKGRQRSLLETGEEQAFLSKELVTIRTDLPLTGNLQDYLMKDIFPEQAREFFIENEMQSILKDFFPEAESVVPASSSADTKDYRLIRTLKELDEAVKMIRARGEVSFDTETTSLDARSAQCVGVSLSWEEGSGVYVPLVSASLFSDDIPDRDETVRLLKEILEDRSIRKIGQNMKYDMIILRNEGIELQGIYFDTMIASYLLNPSERRHNLDDMAMEHLSYRTIKFHELTGKGKKAIPITEVPLEDLARYAAEDAEVAFRLYKFFDSRLSKGPLRDLFENVEMSLVPVLVDMEYRGVRIDPAHFATLGRLNDEQLGETEKKIYDLAGSIFNINSTRELSSVLFEKLGLKPQKKTKTGYSTDISVLEALRREHEIIELLISYRTLAKLKSTYIESLPLLINPRTGRIHTSYNQTVVATGRLSSSNPNLQNIPVRDEFGRKIRQGFIAEEGFIILSADYSQIELRIAAHLCDDEQMKKAFSGDMDIHALTASSVFGVPVDKITPEMRRQAKIINFATIYGVSPFGLSQQAEIGIKEAGEFIKIYFETYPGFKDYIDRTIAFAKEKGYVETMLGRRRPVPDIDSSAVFRREGAQRVAINTPIQGTSADLIKLAMVSIHREIGKKGLKSRMILQVHDELVFEVALDERDIMEELVRRNMEGALKLSVPLVVDMGWGATWEEAH